MVQSCSAYNCTERYKSGSGISFHIFPQDLILKKQWIVAMRLKNFKPSKHTRICSKHFTSDSFITNPWSSKKNLKCHAIPTIFDFPSHLTKKTATRKPPVSRKHSPNVEVVKQVANTSKKEEEPHIDEPPAKKRRFIYVGDFKEACLTRDLQYRHTLNNVLAKKQKLIKLLQQRNRRLVKKVSNLKSLLEHLKEQRIIDEDSALKISDTMSASTKTIFKQLLKSKQARNYPPELKSFALTLNFYSPKAYSYVRKTFTKEESFDDHNYALNCLNYSNQLSLYVSDVVEYIAGFVVKQVKKKLDCDICIKVIQSEVLESNLIKIKNYSNVKRCLIQPSKDVIHICKVAESEIRMIEKTNKLHEQHLIIKLVRNIMSNVKESVFNAYKEHMYDNDVESNHIINLIKIVGFEYCNIRLYYQGECLNKNLDRIRSKLTKTVLFRNQ